MYVELWVALIGFGGVLVQAVLGPAWTLWFNRKSGAKRKVLSKDVETAVEAAIAKYVIPLAQDVEKIKKRQKDDLRRRNIYVPEETAANPALAAEERDRALAFAEEPTPVDRGKK